MNNNVLFSIILPLYNKEEHIEKTIHSIINQTYSNFELIIIDDGSTDNSYEIVKRIIEPRISLIRQSNGGPSKARNRGIYEAKGKYISFIDADDAWHPQYLEKQSLKLNQNPEIMWACVGYKKVYKGQTKTTFCYSEDGVIDDVADILLQKPYIWTGAIAVKSAVFQDKRLYFNEKYKRSEDLELWYKLACLYPKIGYTSEILAYYKVAVEGSLTVTANENEDFSFLTLRQRIEHELNQTKPERRDRIIKTIDSFCKRELLKTWKSTNLFKGHEKKFKNNFSNRLYLALSYLNSMPIFIKKVYVRLLELTNNTGYD